MIYLDNHATTPCDPRVVEAMLPFYLENYGNPHSGHAAGKRAAEAVSQSIDDIARSLNVTADSIVITSGATESNNLAIRGVCMHPRQKRRHIVTVTTEHPAVLDVARDLEPEGFRVTHVPVIGDGSPRAGTVDLNRLADAIDEDTALVSVMWANNEIGAISSMKEISDLCMRRDVMLHSDATQAVGQIDVDLSNIKIDLLSATAHKMYGPKGTGLLVVGGGGRRVRLKPQIVGGGQQRGLRSGTVNPAGVAGIATAIRLGASEWTEHHQRVEALRNRLWNRLFGAIEGLLLNGPALDSEARLAGNLNLRLPAVEGQAWMSAAPEILFSSGSACSGHEAAPSHVLTALGLNESDARRSVRFGVGRFTTEDEIDRAADLLIEAHETLLKTVG